MVLRSPAGKPSRGRPTDRPPHAACFPFPRVCFISHFLFLLSRSPFPFLPSSRSRAVQPGGHSGCASPPNLFLSSSADLGRRVRAAAGRRARVARPYNSSSRLPTRPIRRSLAVRRWLPPPSPSPRRRPPPSPPGPRHSPPLTLSPYQFAALLVQGLNVFCDGLLMGAGAWRGKESGEKLNGCRVGITRKVTAYWLF